MLGDNSTVCRAFSGGKPALILDGGLGTTLEDVLHTDISTSLWSAKPIDDDPELIIKAHLAFLHAGADVVLTSTYQCAFETFGRAGYSREDAVRIMRKSVQLSVEARQRYLTETGTRRSISIALSLGPYGATLSPAQEFDGYYPPPYGPRAYSLTKEDEPSQNHNAFPYNDTGREAEQAAVDALAAFHFERLRVFAQDVSIWHDIDYVALETVPLVREVKAIRRAVAVLQAEMRTGWKMKSWWISTVWPGGRFPEEKSPGGERYSVQEVVHAALGEGVQLARPDAFGVNCTAPQYLGDLLQEMTSAAAKLQPEEVKTSSPWLVVYPNRGDVYDVVSRTWSSSGPQGVGEGWAKSLVDAVQGAMEQEIWSGLVIGGCCKTTPEEIAALVKL